MKTLIRPALTLFVVLSAITGAVYPLVVTGVAQVTFPEQAAGSLISGRDGKPIGSALIGQNFSDPGHFWSRPSAPSPQAYNAAASGGANQGPLNPALTDAVKARIEALQTADPGNKLPIPADLVTASASGLDPHISPAAAAYQLPRIARSRGLPETELVHLVAQYTEDRQLGLFGEPRVNVLKLNLALENLKK